MARIKKRYFILGFLFLLIFALLFFLSTITKDYIVKHSEKMIGRKLNIGELHFNYAKTAVQVKDFVLYEENKTDSFASFSEFYISINPWKLPFGEYSVSELRLVQPHIQVIQNGEKFNFTSLIPKKDTIAPKDTVRKALKFTIRNIQLIDGKVKYQDLQKKSLMEMLKFNLKLPLIAWNNEQSNMGVDFILGEKGRVNVQATVDIVKKKYQIDLNTQDVEIQPFTGYLKDYLDVKSVNGLLTSNMKIVGDMNEVTNISLTGRGSLTNVSMVDGHSEKILTSPKVFTSINDINLKKFHFGFGKIELDEPKMLLVRDKRMTNLERLFLPYFRNDSISSASGKTSVDETPVTYNIDTIKVNKGLVSISDNTLNRPFKYDLNDMNVTMTGLSDKADRIPVVFSTKLNNKGELTGKTIWSMVDLMNLEMEAKVKRMDLISFSPYTEYYVASPITKGQFNYDLGLKMTKTKLSNNNKVEADNLEFGKRTKDTTAMKVPIRLALYIMKDAKGVISFDLPVEGNPSDPKFRLGPIIWKTFTNLMAKVALSPFKALAGLVGANPESLEKVPFAFAQDSLDSKQRSDLSKLADILKKKPDLVATLTQTTDPEEEKKQIAILLTKVDFLSAPKVDSLAQKPDSIKPKTVAGELKNDDPNLLAFIRKSVPALDSIGIQQACLKRVDRGRIESRFQSILAERNRKAADFLTVDQAVPAASVNVSTADFRTLPKELRVPQFKVEVSIK
jgi:hypothetical protein